MASVPKAMKTTKANWSTVTPTTAEDAADNGEGSSSAQAAPVKKKKGGLLTAEDIRLEQEALAEQERIRDEEQERERQAARKGKGRATDDADEVDEDYSDEEQPDHERTVYRDRTGKIMDMKAEEEEQRKKQEDDERKKKAKKEWGKGLVQRSEREERSREERQMASSSFARTASDRDMNREMAQEERWNDPAAAFLTRTKKKGPRRPQYNGPAPQPNRFGIRPGFRWDGVDRSTGYESKLFQKQNDRRRLKVQANAWSTEDM